MPYQPILSWSTITSAVAYRSRASRFGTPSIRSSSIGAPRSRSASTAAITASVPFTARLLGACATRTTTPGSAGAGSQSLRTIAGGTTSYSGQGPRGARRRVR